MNTSQEINARRFMTIYILGIGLLVGLGVGAIILFLALPWGIGRPSPPATGRSAPDFSLSNLRGQEVHLGSLKGTPVVVNFWATWCPPCRDEMPVFDAAARRLSGKVIFLAVDYDEDEQTVKNFVADNHLALPILLDPGGKVVDQYYVRSFPTTFFIDAEGIVRAQHIGGMNEQELANYLERTGFQP